MPRKEQKPERDFGIILRKLAIIITVISLIVGFFYLLFQPKYPHIVSHYKSQYAEMVKSKNELLNYTRDVLKYSIAGLNYSELLIWEHLYLTYISPSVDIGTREELPIPIIEKGIGRCGEFALLYNGLLLTNGYTCRIVIDCSDKTDDRLAGDHVWNEVFLNGMWVHVDPTEQRINEPKMYVRDWEKNVNKVFAVTDNEIIDVTSTYR